MKVLLRQARIISSSSPFNGHTRDILINEGMLQLISENITEPADLVIENKNLHVSIGWMDVFSHFGDPGYEHRETLETGAAAAAAGGFTDVMVIPNTSPPISSKSPVEYILQKAAGLAVNVYPIGSATKNTEGKELSEMYDMHSSGAIAFSDGTQPIQSPGVMLKALQYISAINRVMVQLPDDKSLGARGMMNEGIMSTRLGLPGRPAIAEELMIARDIELLKYTGSKLHITGVSTKKGMELIAKAKNDGLQLTASVTPYHCFFCDEDLAGYDTNLKVDPPLRTRSDMQSIRAALDTGVIDCIASHHMPHHTDDKVCEFEYAKNGMSGLESVFGVMNDVVGDLPSLIEKLTITPRSIFNLALPKIEIGEPACLTLFDPSATYILQAQMIRSKSLNNAFIGREMKGRVIGIINKNKTMINNNEAPNGHA